MTDHTLAFPTGTLGCIEDRIPVFSDDDPHNHPGDVEDGQKVVFFSIGPGETRVTVLDEEGYSSGAWVAVFGWSSLCELDLSHRGDSVHLSSPGMLSRALRSCLRLYGEDVDTTDFTRRAKKRMQGALSHIADCTIGDGREHDRIILAAPAWLHPVLEDCIGIRPHIDPTIQEL